MTTTPHPTLAELADRATASRDRPAYGHDALITCDRLVRVFSTDGVEVQALQGLDLLVREGELMALVGASGSGKSTLMNILAQPGHPDGRRRPGRGPGLADDVGEGPARLPPRRRRLRLAADLAQSDALSDGRPERRPADAAGWHRGRRAARAERALRLLDLMGIADCRDRRPHQMSGGQQQRVAIAVALANDPAVLLADEPTGELDSQTAERIFAAFRTANEHLGTTVVIVTHDQAVAERGQPHGRHPRRPHIHGSAAPQRGGRRDGRREGGGPRVRDAGPRGLAPTARRVHTRPRHARPGRPGTGSRPHRRTPGRQRRGPAAGRRGWAAGQRVGRPGDGTARPGVGD
ncbi:ABC transporter ATP-binding protein [Streptomyces sp. UP1A-1]|nr:ABC transporter ATP-binding protein [Streptomyces sp. UP1A-1]